jgi:tetratricopeptide (TPR) repeat protein
MNKMMEQRLEAISRADKADSLRPNENEMRHLVDFFAQQDKAYYPMALYYMGRTYREMSYEAQAREYFLRTIEVVNKDHYASSDNYYKGKAYSQLGSIYLFQNLQEEAIKMYRQSYAVNAQMKDTLGMVFNLRDIANSYYSKIENDSSIIYCNRALTLIGNEESWRSLATESRCLLVSNYLDEKRTDEAQRLIPLIVADITEAQTPAVLTTVASYYYASGQYDRCKTACTILIKKGKLFDRQKAARLLADIYQKEGNSAQSLFFSKAYGAYTDSLMAQRKTETLARLNAMYNYSQKEKENIALKASQRVFRSLFILALVVLAAGAVIIFVLYRMSQQKEALMRLKLDHYESLRKNLVNKKEEEKTSETHKIENTEIYKTIRRYINSPESIPRLHDDEWQQLENAVNMVYPNFKNHLFDLCKMNEHEYHVSLLIKIGLQPSVIAVLTAHSRESITATRRRLFLKAFGKKGAPKDWDEFILSL